LATFWSNPENKSGHELGQKIVKNGEKEAKNGHF
jgi:hypothetical protein